MKGVIPRNEGDAVKSLETVGPKWIRTQFAVLYRIRENVNQVVAKYKSSFSQILMVPPKIIADKVRSLDTGFLTIYYTNVPKYANKIYRPESVKKYENVFSSTLNSLKMENSLTDEFFSRSLWLVQTLKLL